jgi:hypothetical protein
MRALGIGYRASMIRSPGEDRSAGDQGTAFEAGSIARLAFDWLAAEREVAAGIRDPAQSEETARTLSAQYDEAIRGASLDQLREAWERAQANQAARETGSESWTEARRLAELLRAEYEAAKPDDN